MASPLLVRGRATPGALIEVTPRAEGTRTLGGIISYAPYREELAAIQVRANQNGTWQIPAFVLPRRPRNVAGFQIIVSAVQRDASGTPSDPVEIIVTPRAQQ